MPRVSNVEVQVGEREVDLGCEWFVNRVWELEDVGCMLRERLIDVLKENEDLRSPLRERERGSQGLCEEVERSLRVAGGSGKGVKVERVELGE